MMVESGEKFQRDKAALSDRKGRRQPPRILVAEDEAVVALTIQRQLKKLGYDPVGVVSCGEDVIDVTSALKPDLILMDIRFSGGIDGIAIADEIRRKFDIPVVFLTAYSDEDTLQRAIMAQPYAYVLKPFDERDLLVAVEVALQKHSAEERLHASEQRKEEVISIVAHELRTPLTSIKGSLAYLASESTSNMSPYAVRMLDIAQRSVDRMQRLINDLLDLDRIESGKMSFSLERQPLCPLLEGAVDALRPLGIQLVLHCPDTSIEAVVDADRFQQVLNNLVSNAAKASPKDQAVHIYAERIPDGVRIAVQDSGPGIPEEFRSRIFQRFEQAHSHGVSRKTGSGLGLSIAKVIVEHMNGRIGFESAPGQETTFYFELPA